MENSKWTKELFDKWISEYRKNKIIEDKDFMFEYEQFCKFMHEQMMLSEAATRGGSATQGSGSGGGGRLESGEEPYASNLNYPFTWDVSYVVGSGTLSADNQTVEHTGSGFTILNTVYNDNNINSSTDLKAYTFSFTVDPTSDAAINAQRASSAGAVIGTGFTGVTAGWGLSITYMMDSSSFYTQDMTVGFSAAAGTSETVKITNVEIDESSFIFDPTSGNALPTWDYDSVTGSSIHSLTWESGSIRFDSTGSTGTEFTQVALLFNIPEPSTLSRTDYYVKISGVTGSCGELDFYMGYLDSGDYPIGGAFGEVLNADLTALQGIDGTYESMVFNNALSGSGTDSFGMRFRTIGGGSCSFLIERVAIVNTNNTLTQP